MKTKPAPATRPGGQILLRALVASAGALPWVAAVFAERLPPVVTSAVTMTLAPLCHHRPERTLELAGRMMAVCSRCAGVYGGVTLGALFVLRGVRTRALRRGLLLVLAAAGIDILTQDLGLHPPWHVARLATGLLVGWLATAWMMAELQPKAR